MLNISDAIKNIKTVIPNEYHCLFDTIIYDECYQQPEHEREQFHKLYEILMFTIIGFDEECAKFNFDEEWIFEAASIYSGQPIQSFKDDYNS